MRNNEPRRKVTEEFARRDEAEQQIRNHIEGHEMESPRFQAFCDFVDLKQVKKGHDQTEARLIMETIRQRKNDMRGYKWEYNKLSELMDGLMRSLHKVGPFTSLKDYDQRGYFEDLFLPRFKNEAIERFNPKPKPSTSSRNSIPAAPRPGLSC